MPEKTIVVLVIIDHAYQLNGKPAQRYIAEFGNFPVSPDQDCFDAGLDHLSVDNINFPPGILEVIN
ncbi:hypothetical protein BMS3Bbin09_00205 [bacterium BMS3Bbin09]|nr:hypothetical protein BMS3Bbin09_00205 [bacterium BMS3Bbin09]